MAGKVYLVGAGPGDPELLTLKARRLLQEAEVVLYDRLLSPRMMEGLKAELIDVGKSAGRHKLTQEEINQLLIEKAEAGHVVVRLKGGDPFVFGRGGEEALALRERGIAVEVVPGVTSAVAVPELAWIPVTHRHVSTSLTVVTGHEEPGKDNPLDWGALARLGGTLVVLMGVSRLAENTDLLIRGGRSPETPAAIIEKGGWPEQRTVRGTLGTISELAREAGVEPPAILVVGEVVKLAPLLATPRMAIFRARNQMADSVALCQAYGFQAVPAPAIGLKPLELPGDLKERIEGADCVVFTSSNGVEMALKHDLKDALSRTRVAAIGPMTGKALEERGIAVALMPREFSSLGLVEALSGCRKVLLLRSARGSPALVSGLQEKGVEVEDLPIYDLEGSGDPLLDELIRIAAGLDVFAFTSGSTSRYLIKRAREMGMEDQLRRALARARVAAIGPPTADELERLGIRVDVMPERYTFEEMLKAIKESMRPE
ncbi:MAG: uroporphyrinogen-III C-methyltransferase [Methanosarcinales archaeon]|nr:uroporphyrinogen-III C-methyltransferase [Methanosarcinales archaeon]